MQKGGIIVRLIDVVLILLFGFISISEISRHSQIELPTSEATPLTNPSNGETLIIGINRDGNFLVDNETQTLTSHDELVGYIDKQLAGLEDSEKRPRVQIRANWDTPIKYTIALANLCDQRQLLKGIDVIRKGK
ncbi:biopolymer transporter ExbD [candidate division KSB1 bacterium]|nr:biopolymer transporter ExbD [candidate division KSB1 bacterium]